MKIQLLLVSLVVSLSKANLVKSLLGDEAPVFPKYEMSTNLNVLKYLKQETGILGCTACQMGVGYFDSFLNEKKTMATIEDLATYVCATFMMPNATVCEPAVRMMAPIVIPNLTKLKLGPDFLCSGTVAGFCDYPKYKPLSADDYAASHLTLKKPELKNNDFMDKIYDKIAADKSQRKTLKVLHISDIHFDFDYTPGTIKTCNMPLCCNPMNGFTSDPELAARPFGEYSCDLPEGVLTDMLKYISAEIKPDTIAWTGDNSVHKVWNDTEDEIIQYTQRVT